MARKMVEVQNVNHPGQVKLVDGAMYDAMKRAMLKVLPKTPPGVTVEENVRQSRELATEGFVCRRSKGRLVGENSLARFGGERAHCTREDPTAALAQGLMS